MSCSLEVCRWQENGHSVMVDEIQPSQICLDGVCTHFSLVHPIFSRELPFLGKDGSIGGLGHRDVPQRT